MSAIHQRHPNAGVKMVLGYLMVEGHIVQRERVRESLRRIDPASVSKLWSNMIVRRRYYVPSANSLWHMDGHMKLIRWKFATHGCVDGKTRLITFLECASGNSSSTVLDLFVKAVLKNGVPSRVRSDYGGENIQVATFINLLNGRNRASHITGESVHYQRIERLWRDVYKEVVERYYIMFYEFEDEGILNPSNDVDIFCLHYACLDAINKDLSDFVQAWNNHGLRTERNQSPYQLWVHSMLNSSNILPSSDSSFSENLQARIEDAIQEISTNSDDVIEESESVVIDPVTMEISPRQNELMFSRIGPETNIKDKYLIAESILEEDEN